MLYGSVSISYYLWIDKIMHTVINSEIIRTIVHLSFLIQDVCDLLPMLLIQIIFFLNK